MQGDVQKVLFVSVWKLPQGYTLLSMDPELLNKFKPITPAGALLFIFLAS